MTATVSLQRDKVSMQLAVVGELQIRHLLEEATRQRTEAGYKVGPR